VTVGDLKHLIIGVDLDGVCSDFYGRMREVAAEWFERSRRAWRQGVEKGIKVERELSSEKVWSLGFGLGPIVLAFRPRLK